MIIRAYSLRGETIEISPKELAKEAKYTIGVKPLRAIWGKEADGITRIAILSFPRLIKSSFRLFGDLAPSCPL